MKARTEHIALLLLGALVTVNGTPLIRMELGPDDHPKAVCNDGTRAIYFHSPNPPKRFTQPPAKKPSHFVIFLQGGYFCETVEECDKRCKVETPYYCTANRLEALEDTSRYRQGILSDDIEENPSFAHYYKVYQTYCTSDMYIGARASSEETGGYQFNGWAVFTALVNSLTQHAGLSQATRVILTGTSAGGRGAAFTCPYLRKLLPYSVDVRCVVDAAIFYPQPFVDGCQPFNELIANANSFWHGNVEGFDIHSWWRAYPTPLFIAIQSQDMYAHLYHCIDPSNSEHLWKYGHAMVELAKNLTVDVSHVGLYMPSCNRHPMVTDPHFFSRVKVGVEELTLTETLSNWVNGEGTWHVFDDCSTADHPVCNPRCEHPRTKNFLRYPLNVLEPVAATDQASPSKTKEKTEL